jgi:hypothetical protein
MILPHYTLQDAIDAGWEGVEAVQFSNWMDQVSRHIQSYTGLTIQDVSDWTWAAAFEDGMLPDEAAQEFLTSEMQEYME